MNGQPPQAESRDTHLSLLSLLRRGLPIVLASALVSAAVAVGLSLQQDELHRARAEVFVSTRELQTSIGDTPNFTDDPARILATQAEVARVPGVAEIALKRADADLSVPSFLDRSSVAPAPDADILSFSVTDQDPDAARELADAYAHAYVAFRERQDTGAIEAAREDIEAKIATLTASGDAEPGVVADLIKRSDRLRTLALLQGANTSVGGPADPAEKVQPRPVTHGVLGGVLGIVLGISLVFIRDALNTRVRTAPEIEKALGMPLIGKIPPPPKRIADAGRLATLEESHSVSAEAYRMMATNIELLNLDRGARSVMISSALRAEGKSTTAANLAVALAGRGLHVVLLEADLRRPALARMFGIDEAPGLTDAALGSVALEKALRPIALPDAQDVPGNGAGASTGTLEVLTSGSKPPASAAEFLKSPPVAAIVARLTERADLLLIDTPPLLHVSDAMTMMLTAGIDCVILAARLGQVRRQAVADARRLLDTAPVVKLGFFATGGEAGDRYPGDGYYPYYGDRRELIAAARHRLTRS